MNDHELATTVRSQVNDNSVRNPVSEQNDIDFGRLDHFSMTEHQNEGLVHKNLAHKSEETKGLPIHDSTNNVLLKVENMDPDTVCGIGRFKPDWIQKFATVRCYLAIYSILGMLQGSYYAYLVGIVTTIEKRYAFKTKISGAIMMVDEITPLLLAILVGYFGGRMHRPRVLAIGMFLSSLCCFISALPYFMYGTSQHLVASSVKNETATEHCDRVKKYEDCDEDYRFSTLSAVACFFVGSFFKGFGSLTYHAVGLPYLDDNAKKKHASLYIAIVQASRMSGPVVGFLMSSAFLKYYENPFGDPGYGPEDPRWIGAWWMGFVLQGVLLIIFAFPILLFPRRLPKQRQRTSSNTGNFAQESYGQKFMGLIKALKRLITSPLYMVFSVAAIFTMISVFGLHIILPKYMEIQFGLTASEASLLSGPPSIVACQVMTIVGGWAIWKWRPSTKKLLIAQVINEVAWTIGALTLILPSCERINMAGVTLTEQSLLDVQTQCNADCLCSTSAFSPVCGPDGISNYFSPCHAGCTMQNGTEFSNCSCLVDSQGGLLNFKGEIKSGFCEREGCWSQRIVYMILLPTLVALTDSIRVAHWIILLRCVAPEDKSIAIGFFETLICALALIPYPVIFGSLVDSVCLIWEESCGETGNCWFYDIEKLNYLLHGSSAFCAFVAVILFIIIVTMSDRVRDLYIEDIDGINSDNSASKTANQLDEYQTNLVRQS